MMPSRCRYRQGLESLNEHLSEIKVELVLPPGARTSSFRPGLEEIRATYYKEVRPYCCCICGCYPWHRLH